VVKFYAGNTSLVDVESSGFGFYGSSGFGASVQVGAYNGKTFVTNGAGTALGPECWNIARTHANSGSIAGGSSLVLTAIPNYQATFNIRATFDVPVTIPNAQLRVYDRVNTNNGPSGVTCYAAELRHTGNTQTNNGSGSTSWQLMAGSGNLLNLISSPGESGFRPSGANTSDDRHDFYVAMSCSPDSVGSKTQFGMYFSMEYL
jgi:hypothetical protein